MKTCRKTTRRVTSILQIRPLYVYAKAMIQSLELMPDRLAPRLT